MPRQIIASHHLDKRRRIHLKHEAYPHPNKFKRFVDKIILVIGVISPLLTLPQVLKVWILQNAAGLSLISWVGYIIFDTVWLTYGIIHRLKPIIIAYIIWLILEIIMLIGVLKYGDGLW